MTTEDVADRLRMLHAQEWSKLVGAVTRLTRDPDLAEEVVSEAYAAALRRWPSDGIPENPPGWLYTTARNRVLDQYRRDQRFAAKVPALLRDAEGGPTAHDELGLLFACCHPAIGISSQVAATLRLVGGLDTSQIARLLLTSEATAAQRIVRAKRTLRGGEASFGVPAQEEWGRRLDGVLAVLYLMFTEGYAPSSGPDLTRPGLCEEALRLAERLAALLPDEAEPLGLVALMRLQHSRRHARTDRGGRLVQLREQDRSEWDERDIKRGLVLTERALRLGRAVNRVGPYQIQAAIAAVHAGAAMANDTDWEQIVALYRLLRVVAPSPVVELNHAIAVAEADGGAAGAQRGLDLLDSLNGSLASNHLFHAARAELLQRAGRHDEAVAALERALDLARTTPERLHMAALLRNVETGANRTPDPTLRCRRPDGVSAAGPTATR